MSYDSTQDTLEHIRKVQARLQVCIHELTIRAAHHDESKLQEPEKAGFDQITEQLRDLAYGSPEYKAALQANKPTIDHHYAHNSHHPEHWPTPEGKDIKQLKRDIRHLEDTGLDPADPEYDHIRFRLRADLVAMESRVNNMSLLDIIEMLCDWKASSERTKQGSIAASLVHNKQRFGISDQLASILENTVKELNW